MDRLLDRNVGGLAAAQHADDQAALTDATSG
jgi:hypothetical protein